MGKCSIYSGKTGILMEWPLKDGQFCKKCNKKFQDVGFRYFENWYSENYTVQEAVAMLSQPEEWRTVVNERNGEREEEKKEKARIKELNKNCFLCGKRIMIRYMTSDNRALCLRCMSAVRTIFLEEFLENENKFDPIKYVEEHSANFFMENMGEIEHPHPRLSINFTKRNFYCFGDPDNVFTFDSVVKFESDIHTYEVEVGKKGHPIARAVAGGALLGSVGAVIGASTSKDTRHKEIVKGKRYVNIYYKDPAQKAGIQKEVFYSDDEMVIVKIEECLKRAFEIKEKQKEEENFKSSSIQDGSPNGTQGYSQLVELKNLLDMGILTREEFERKKKDILNL